MSAKTPAIPRRRSRSVDPAHPVYEVDLWLGGSDPLIWRSLIAPADMTLDRLHELIQAVMGWHNCHMHQFMTRSGRHFEPAPGLDAESLDEADATLREVFADLKDTLGYEYDFGDSWEHGIRLVKTHADGSAFAQVPACLDGRRAGPLEDSGGIFGYEDIVRILRDPDPKDEWHRDVLEWAAELHGGEFDPEAFDVDETNRVIASVFAPRRSKGRPGGRRGSGGGKRKRR